MSENSLTNQKKKEWVKFEYTADSGQLFGIYLKNILLSIVTLGIYRFWGEVEITKYLYSNTSFLGRAFGYHATGKERFIGFLKGMVIVALLFGIFAGLQMALMGTGLEFLLVILVYGLGLIAAPFIMVGSQRYKLSRSSWSNVRFRFDGTYKEFLPIFLKNIGLLVVTLGIYAPWYANNIQAYFTDKSNLGNKSFQWDGNGVEMFKIYLKGILLSIVTFGIYSFWFTADLNKYTYAHTSLDGNRLDSSMTGGDFFKLYLLTVAIVMFTFGLAFPVALNIVLRTFFSKLSMELDEDSIQNIQNISDEGASALADGITEAAEAVDAVSGMF